MPQGDSLSIEKRVFRCKCFIKSAQTSQQYQWGTLCAFCDMADQGRDALVIWLTYSSIVQSFYVAGDARTGRYPEDAGNIPERRSSWPIVFRSIERPVLIVGSVWTYVLCAVST